MSPRKFTAEDFAEREAELIGVARAFLECGCLTELTIDRLVAEAPYSKGTVYKHFISKEDLILGLCNTCMREVHELFLRALSFDGHSREKVLAVLVSYLVWAKLHPSQLFTVLAAHSPTVATQSSEKRRIEHHEWEEKLMSMVNETMDDAIQIGDFNMPVDLCQKQVTFALWSATWGAMALIISKGTSEELQQMVLERETLTNVNRLLDGFCWKPYTSDWDYKESVRRIATEILQPEIAALEQRGTPFVFI